VLSYDELLSFLLERGATGDCPSCGRYDWLGADDFALLPSLDREGDRHPLGVGYRALVMACGNCGFMNMHSVGTLESLIESETDHPESSEASEQG
jgi:hypothetical protein